MASSNTSPTINSKNQRTVLLHSEFDSSLLVHTAGTPLDRARPDPVRGVRVWSSPWHLNYRHGAAAGGPDGAASSRTSHAASSRAVVGHIQASTEEQGCAKHELILEE